VIALASLGTFVELVWFSPPLAATMWAVWIVTRVPVEDCLRNSSLRRSLCCCSFAHSRFCVRVPGDKRCRYLIANVTHWGGDGPTLVGFVLLCCDYFAVANEISRSLAQIIAASWMDFFGGNFVLDWNYRCWLWVYS